MCSSTSAMAKLPLHLRCLTLAEGTVWLKIPPISSVRSHTVKGSLTRDFWQVFSGITIPLALSILLGSFRIFLRKFVETLALCLSPMSLKPVLMVYFRIAPRIFVKVRNGPHGMRRCPGKLIHEKNLKSKISYQTPFKKKYRQLPHYNGRNQRHGFNVVYEDNFLLFFSSI
jgi:hypothetical protein